MKITFLSDTHSKHHYINWDGIESVETDLLIISGDISMMGYREEVEEFFRWLNKFPAEYKVLTAGNHDLTLDPQRGGNSGHWPDWLKEVVAAFEWYGGGVKQTGFYLENTGCEIEGVKIWGSPVTPWFFGETWAFNKHRGPENIGKTWELIPADTDILITHGPPLGYGDFIPAGHYGETESRSVGCADLLKRVQEIKPALHLFGHIHEGYGFYGNTDTIFLNGSVVDYRYYPVNKPWIFNYSKNGSVSFELQGGLGADSATGENASTV